MAKQTIAEKLNAVDHNLKIDVLGRQLKLLVDAELEEPFEVRIARQLVKQGITEANLWEVSRLNSKFKVFEPMLAKISNAVRDIERGLLPP